MRPDQDSNAAPDSAERLARMLAGTAAADQMAESMRTYAGYLAAYYLALRERGVPRRLAAELTLDYQGHTLHHGATSDGQHGG